MCRFASAQIVDYPCRSCEMRVCIGRIQCNLGLGQVLLTVACQLDDIKSDICPLIEKCVKDNRIRMEKPITDPLMHSDSTHSSSTRNK